MVVAGEGKSAPRRAGVELLWARAHGTHPSLPLIGRTGELIRAATPTLGISSFSLTFGQSLRGEQEQGTTKASLCLYKLFQKSDQAATGNTGHQLETVECSDTWKVR